MDKAGINQAAAVVSQALQQNPDLIDIFKSRPDQVIKDVTGIKGLSDIDVGSILSVLLDSSEEGGSLPGTIINVLLDGKKTKAGEKNVVGELVGQVLGDKKNRELIGSLVSTLLSSDDSKATSSKKASPAKKTSSTKAGTSKKASTAKKSTDTAKKGTTASKSTGTAKKGTSTSKSTPAKKPSTTSKSKSSKKGGSDDVLGTIGTIIDKSGVDVADIVGNLLSKKKK